VTHDPDDARSFPERVIAIENGKITQTGSFAQLAKAPATPFIADFAQ
jgi:ABC-type sulfate/molybdate transport systems ATPase subunit